MGLYFSSGDLIPDFGFITAEVQFLRSPYVTNV